MSDYIFLQLDIKCGEYEFTSVSVHQIPKEKNIIDFSEEYAKQFYYGDMEEEDRTYYFNAGEVAVEVSVRQNISKEEYSILRKYL